MTNDEKDQRFAVLLTIAGQARSYFDDALIRVASSEHLSRTDLPDYLLIGMSYLASYQNQALLWCLAKPEASYGAEILARGLLEFLAQTAFVLGKETDSPIGTPEQRAACVSLARAREEYKILYEARDAGAVDRPAGNALERVWMYLDLHEQLGCPGRTTPWLCLGDDGKTCRHKSQWPCFHESDPRPRVTVRHTLERLALRLNRPWLLHLYITSSLISHQQMIDRIVHWAEGQDLDLPGPPSYQYRAIVLSASVGAYGQALGWILESHSIEESRKLEPYFAVLYQMPDWQSVASGAWD